MKKRLLPIITLLFAFGFCAFSQQEYERCSSMEYLQQNMEKDPTLKLRMQQIERFIQENIENVRAGTVYEIPVVFHVVYKRNSQNLSDDKIMSQLQVLNDDFRRMNADAVNTPSEFLADAADTEISFCLATQDPNGNPTTGITRTKTRKNQFSYITDDVKFNSSGGKDAWPCGDYLNIWVCNLGSGLLGYAQFPGGPCSTDGVVIDYQYFGTIGASPPFHLGRTATHEVGHWLDLYHIWGDGPGCSSGSASPSCSCDYDDLVNDTPNHGRANYGCQTGQVTCNSTDMPENYMDYSDDACMNLYTMDQKSRMRALFAPGGPRESLLTSPGCGSVATCSVPGNTTISNIADNSANYSWDPVAGALSYNVRNREVGTSTWQSFNTTNTNYTFTGLTACTDYEAQVESVCESTNSGYSGSGQFTTTGCPPVQCDVPSNVSATVLSSRKARIDWDQVASATSYEVRHRMQSGGNWKTKTTSTNTVTLNGLKPNTVYVYQVRAICGTDTSGWSPEQSFDTGSAPRLSGLEALIFPNPASDYISINPAIAQDVVHFEVFDLYGKKVISLNESSISGSGTISLVNLESGIYLLRFMMYNNDVRTEKVIVQH